MTERGRGRQPETYQWRGKIYIGQRAVAQAAGVSRAAVCLHLTKYGHLENLGLLKHGGGFTGKPVTVAGHTWPSISALSREIGVKYSTVYEWLSKKPHRLAEAVMAAKMKGKGTQCTPRRRTKQEDMAWQ